MNKTRCLLGSAILLLGGSQVGAQTHVELGPLGGYYRPTGSFEPTAVYSVALPGAPQDMSSWAWGAEGRIWFGRRFGAQIQVLSAGSNHGPVITPSGTFGPIAAQVTTGSAQVLLNVLGGADRYRVWFSAGSGVVRHGGESYNGVGAQTDIAAAGGIGSSYPITRHLRATGGVNVLLYSYDVPMPFEMRGNGQSLQKGAQQDALFHMGLNWVWH